MGTRRNSWKLAVPILLVVAGSASAQSGDVWGDRPWEVGPAPAPAREGNKVPEKSAPCEGAPVAKGDKDDKGGGDGGISGGGSSRQAVFCASTKSGYGIDGVHMHRQINFGDAPVNKDSYILYMHNFGQYPWGGPQTIFTTPGFMQKHLAKIKPDLDTLVPDPDFDGIIMIDYEEWHPLWQRLRDVPSDLGPDARDWDNKTDWEEYLLSTNKDIFDGMNSEQKETLLKETFNKAAKDYYLATLNEGRKWRPKAQWGFYAYPDAGYGVEESDWKGVAYGDGDNEAKRNNDEMSWMWDAVDYVSPSPYATHVTAPLDQQKKKGLLYNTPEENAAWLADTTKESIRVANGKPVYPMIWFRYHPYAGEEVAYKWVNDIGLTQMIDVPLATGADGILIWDDIPDIADYDKFQKFVTSTVGPKLAAILAKYGDSEGGGDKKDGGKDDGDDGEKPPMSLEQRQRTAGDDKKPPLTPQTFRNDRGGVTTVRAAGTKVSRPYFSADETAKAIRRARGRQN